jgi:NADP-dependent 3-hydroxy acid dehydrogenase YdfG
MMKTNSGGTILITGATAGFGAAMAEKFAQGNYRLIVTGRRAEKLEVLANRLKTQYGSEVLTLCFDVRDKAATEAALGGLSVDWQQIDILVNNAGLALGRDHFDQANMDDWEVMIDTNLKGLLYVTRAALPYLKKSARPHIVNIGSIAGKEVYEKGNVYCATKHAVDAISKSMRIDLLKDKIKVTAIHPGAAETEFSLVRFKGDQQTAASVYAGYEPLVAADIADITWYLTQLPAHVCINDLVVTCTAQANSTLFNK